MRCNSSRTWERGRRKNEFRLRLEHRLRLLLGHRKLGLLLVHRVGFTFELNAYGWVSSGLGGVKTNLERNDFILKVLSDKVRPNGLLNDEDLIHGVAMDAQPTSDRWLRAATGGGKENRLALADRSADTPRATRVLVDHERAALVLVHARLVARHLRIHEVGGQRAPDVLENGIRVTVGHDAHGLRLWKSCRKCRKIVLNDCGRQDLADEA